MHENGDEIAPFIHANDESIYFSSNGFVGMGGFDLALQRLVVLLGIWVKIFDLEETYLQHILIYPELGMD